MPELKVSGTTIPSKLGGAIAKYLEEQPKITVLAMGDPAVGKAVKGIIVAQAFLASAAYDFTLKVGFRTVKDADDGKDVTVIVFFLSRNW